MLSEARNGIRYTSVGTGPAVLLIHGFPLDHTMWIDQIRDLADRAQVIAMDLRGFGSSPRMGGDVLDMETHASDCDLLLEELGIERAHVVGLSMGGYVALALADLFGHRVASLVLMDTKAGPDSAEGKAGRDAMAQRLVAEGRGPVAAGLADGLLGPDPSTFARARLLTMAEGMSYESYVGALMGMKQRPDRTEVLRQFAGPVTVVNGEDDGLFSVADVAAPLAAIAADSELVVIPGAGHLPSIEQPAATTAAIVAHLSRV
jgi:pimeloyl-ACP methyl ester carboxylesterase